MNLEQIYKERFQSFEMEQDSRINLRMKQKIRHFKTMQWIKWIAIGLLISTAAVIISHWSFTAKDTPSQTLSSQTTIKENMVLESANSQTKQSLLNRNAEEMLLEENNTLFIDQNSHQQTPLHEDIKTEEDQNDDGKENHLLSEDEYEITKPSPDRAQVSFSQSDNKWQRKAPTMTLELMKPKDPYYLISKKDHELEGKSANLIPEDYDLSKSKNKGPKAQSYSENLEFDGHSSHMNVLLDVHFSPLLWNNSSKVIDIGIVSDWTSSLNHKAQFSYEMGFSFQLHHQKTPLFLQIGLDYQVLKEKIDDQLSRTYEDPDLSSWIYDSIFDIHTVVDTFYVIIDSNQFVIDTLFTQDTLLMGIDSSFNAVMTTEEKNKKQVNTYTYLNIPLMLGYEFNTPNQRWSFQVLAGGALAINLSNEGYYYRGRDDFESYSGKVSPSFIWSLQAAANINYKWKKWQFYLQPEFQYQLNESKVYEYAPTRKYQFYKLKAGIRFQLF